MTMKALQTSGIRNYLWWVYAGGNTVSLDGSTATYSYEGMPPTSVMLVATDSSGKAHSASAYVGYANGRLQGATP